MTYSPILVLLYVWTLLWILMDVHFCELTRVQKYLIPTLILLLAVLNHVLRHFAGNVVFLKMIPLTMHLPFFLIFLYITRCGIIKMFFMILSAFIFTAPIVIVSRLVLQVHPGSSWILLLSNLTTYAVMLLLAQFIFRQGFNYLLKYGDSRLFLRFLLVPLMYYIYVFAVQNVDPSSFSSVSGHIVKYLPTMDVFVFYFLLLYNYKELHKKRELETAQAALSQQLNGAKEQLALLHKAQTQTAIYQHNIRHHLIAIDGFLSVGKPQQAKEYIKKVQADAEAIRPKRFCENEMVNLLCSSYSVKAEHMGIGLTVETMVPKDLSISDTELCALLSNGLENALRAVSTLEESRRYIKFYCKVKQNKLLIQIKNPYTGEIVMRDGLPVSSQEGHGYGCRSIQTITEQNRGICIFEAENGLFTLRVVMPI